jgi:uncharacterized YccA/Bax inhibitor family protein
MTGNPTLNENTFTNLQETRSSGQAMTIQGAVNKTAILLFLAVVAGSYTWGLVFKGNTAAIMPWMMGGAIAGFIFALVTCFKKEWSAVTAPVYALCEGVFLGGVSAMLEAKYPGLVLQAVMLTFGTLAALLFVYKAGLIRATENFKRGVFAATGGIALLYLTTWILGFFGIHIPSIYGNGIIGIGFSLFVVVVAAMNLVIDFDFIEKGAEAGAPKYMEWYGAFGLMVTLVWLYLEILRLLAKLRSRD